MADRSGSLQFEDRDVVAAYAHRPAYPPELYAALLALAPRLTRVLDLGCGPGKIARAIAANVGQVVAVDPSPAMLEAGQGFDLLEAGDIIWIQSSAEDLSFAARSFDLAIVGAAIHWMEPSVVFPKLAEWLGQGGRLAIVDGDEPSKAPWLGSYQQVIRRWVERQGGVWDGDAHRALMSAHAAWFDVQGEATFETQVVQPIDDFIEAQHSRATWARARMGAAAAEFDEDIRAVLSPWARAGRIAFEVQSRLSWGLPRRAPPANAD